MSKQNFTPAKKDPISADEALKLGKQAVAAGKNDEAMVYFDAVIRKYPDHKEALAAVKAINPNSLFRHDLAELNDQFKKGQFDIVEMRCKILLDRFPDVTEIYDLLGASLASQNKLNEALPLFQKSLEKNPFKAASHYNLGNAYKTLGRGEDAMKSYAEAIRLNPNHFGSYFNMSNLYRIVGQHENALNCLNALDEISPKNPQVYLNIAATYKDKGDNETAIEWFEKFIKLDPNYPGSYHDIGLCYVKLDQQDKAQEFFEKAIEIEPRYLDAYNNLGNILQKKGDIDGSIEQYKKALGLRKDVALTHNNLGNALREKGEFNAAVQCFEIALNISPDNLETIHNAANAYGEKSDFPAAIEKFERARELIYEGPVSISNLAIMNHIIGEEDKTEALLVELTDELLESIKNEPRKAQFCYAYRTLLNRLYKHNKGVKRIDAKKAEKMNKIWVMGPSLTLANRGHTITKDGKDYIAEVNWIAGIKAFHLAQPKHNKYKSSVLAHLATIPKDSEIIFNIGTIDTRVDEGITVAAKKLGKTIEEVAIDTATGYFNFTYDAALEAGLKPIHCGVAAPLTTLDVEGAADAILAINEFNRVIREMSKDKGIMYIDIHKITVTKGGIADGSMHLDPYHLIPTAINQAINA